MMDEVFQERIDAVKRIIEQFDDVEGEEELTTDDADQLLEDGLDQLERAKETLSLGSGRVMVVDRVNGEIVTERFEPLDG